MTKDRRKKPHILQVKQTFQCEDALKLLLNILTIEGALNNSHNRK